MDNNENSPVAPDEIKQDFAEATPEPEQSIANIEPKEKKNKAPLIIAIIVALLLCGGGVTFFLLKDKIFGGQSNSAGNGGGNSQPVSDLPTVDTQLSDFDLAFLKTNNTPNNKIYSPLSIKYALEMLSAGAKGETKAEIDKLIGDYKAKAYLNSKNRSLANALFVQTKQKNSILDSYINGLKTNYAASVVFDDFANADNINKWVSDQTLGIIDKIVDDADIEGLDFALINALAIDMKWNYRIQCGYTENKDDVKSKWYSVHYTHEDYSDSISCLENGGYSRLDFGDENVLTVKAGRIGASINNYDIVKELGEDKIRATVKPKYEAYQKESGYSPSEEYPADADKYLDKYIEELKGNYKTVEDSTDFYMYVDDDVKAFAKDLQKYDGSTLQYIGIMPTKQNLVRFIKASDAKSISAIISKLYGIKAENFKDGVVTKVTGKIPFFKYDYNLDLLKDLKSLGINKVFNAKEADLSNLTKAEGVAIVNAKHKANIDFSNDGITAAAVTMMGGAGAAAGFDYDFEVPVETIDITFNRPYIYIIRDKQSGEVWFTGAVYIPEIEGMKTVAN